MDNPLMLESLDLQVFYEPSTGFDLKAETEQLMNRTQKLLVKGAAREAGKTGLEMDEWVIWIEYGINEEENIVNFKPRIWVLKK